MAHLHSCILVHLAAYYLGLVRSLHQKNLSFLGSGWWLSCFGLTKVDLGVMQQVSKVEVIRIESILDIDDAIEKAERENDI